MDFVGLLKRPVPRRDDRRPAHLPRHRHTQDYRRAGSGPRPHPAPAQGLTRGCARLWGWRPFLANLPPSSWPGLPGGVRAGVLAGLLGAKRGLATASASALLLPPPRPPFPGRASLPAATAQWSPGSLRVKAAATPVAGWRSWGKDPSSRGRVRRRGLPGEPSCPPPGAGPGRWRPSAASGDWPLPGGGGRRYPLRDAQASLREAAWEDPGGGRFRGLQHTLERQAVFALSSLFDWKKTRVHPALGGGPVRPGRGHLDQVGARVLYGDFLFALRGFPSPFTPSPSCRSSPTCSFPSSTQLPFGLLHPTGEEAGGAAGWWTGGARYYPLGPTWWPGTGTTSGGTCPTRCGAQASSPTPPRRRDVAFLRGRG